MDRPDPVPVTWPAWHPPRAVLELAELVVDGLLPRLPDGLVPVGDGDPGLVLQDAEGTPVAAVAADGSVRALQPFSHPPVRSRRVSPPALREQLRAAGPAASGAGAAGAGAAVTGAGAAGRPVGVPVGGPLTREQVRNAVRTAAQAHAPLVWLPMIGEGWDGPPTDGLPAPALLRAVSGLAGAVGGLVAPVALPADHRDLLAEVVAGLGAALHDVHGEPAAGGPAPVHPAFVAELERAVRRPPARGVVVFLTGLSGSGKSTIARGLHERLLDDGRRAVTMLDGDEVRRLLSAGLGFSRADRELNLRRIGFVAAEVARHGGLAICAPIAPFAAARAQVRAGVERVGGEFLLVHVATPLAECERRDRKGLYAQARRGEVADFTGISSPYEVPGDADLTLDTTGVPVQDCVDAVWQLLAGPGHFAD